MTVAVAGALSCGMAPATGSGLDGPVQEAAASGARVSPAEWPAPAWPLATDPAVEARIAELLARMSVEEKVGQMIQADIASVTPEDARRYHLGSVLNGGNSGPGGDDLAPAASWLAAADAFYDASVDRSGGRAGIPILWGTDAVHGHSNIIGATIFPHNVGLGAANDPDLIERIGRATALEIRATGIEWTFAPTLTVPRDYRWGRAYEGYSSEPRLVARYAERMIRGLQGPPGAGPILAGPHVIASTKHFIADGGTAEGRDQGDARIGEAELRDIHGAPYVPAIEQGVATVMTSFSSWNGIKIAGNRGLVTDVLKRRMNFGGFVITDWNAHGQVAGCTNERCPQAINAGIDMVMAPDSWKAFYAGLLADVRSGAVPMARIDDAVARILRVKIRLGLFEAGRPSARPYAGRWDLLGHPDHRAIAREAVRESLVLLKNSGSVLPLKPGMRLLVAGDGADDIARQSGGWTLTWQGTGVDNRDFPGATSIWRGLSEAMAGIGGSAQLAADGRFTRRPDAAVVVFGETPYAEFQGDLKQLALRPDQRAPFETMRRLKEQGIPVIAVMLTGRPLYINPVLNIADAFVVAWLPGSEGGGVADMLVGDRGGRARFDFRGRLPMDWPATPDAHGPRLYPLGHGLKLADAPSPWRALPEIAVQDDGSGSAWFVRGAAAPSWSLQLSRDGAAGSRVTTVPMQALNGDASVTATDHAVQEGARAFVVRKGGARIELASQEPIDLSRESNGDVQLVFTMRLDAPGTAGISLGMACADARCAAQVPLDPAALAAPGTWRSYGIPLKCFERAGADLRNLTIPFRLTIANTARLSLSGVGLGTGAETQLRCPTG